MRVSVVIVAAAALLAADAAFGQVSVNGYIKKDGTYVAPYQRTAPNGTKDDNYSTRGNVNPYTGAPGTKPGDYGLPAIVAVMPPLVTPAPVAGTVMVNGWISAGASGDNSTQMYIMPAVTPAGGKQRTWVRFDVRDNSGVRSVVDLEEVDCSLHSRHIIQETSYAGPGMTGASAQVPVAYEWHYPVPGTMDSVVVDATCAALTQISAAPQ